MYFINRLKMDAQRKILLMNTLAYGCVITKLLKDTEL